MVDQSNMYGNLSWKQIGTAPDGTPLYGSSLNFSPQQQSLYDLLTGSQTAAGQQGQNLIKGANYGSQSPTQAIGDQSSGIQGQMMSQWLKSQQPWMTQQTDQLDTKLRNQGINPSPTATNDPSTWGPYERAMGQNTQSQQMGVAGAASQFQPQAFQEATSLYQMPAQLGSALAQFGAPTSPGSSIVQAPGLQIGPPDLTGAVSAADKARMDAWQAEQQRQGSLMSGLFGLGGNILGGMARGPGGLAGGLSGLGALFL
jgi:hypothetical protein